MNKKRMLCMVMAFVLALSVFVFSSSAENDQLVNSITIIDNNVDAVDNDLRPYFSRMDRGYITTITSVLNPDGTFCLCIAMNDGSLKILELNKDFSIKNTVSVPLELSTFLAFSKGEDGTYYLLFNQPLTIATRNQTALRVINVDQNGKKLRTLDMSGMTSGAWLGIAQHNCGNGAMITNGNYLTGYIARDMFPVVVNPVTGKDEFAEGGTIHQASYSFAIDLSTFTQVRVADSTVIPYASHSLQQAIIKDGNDFLYVDRSDAEPFRSYHLTKMSGGLQWKELREGNSFIFKGSYAQNDTYGQLAGAVRCGNKYLLVGTYENTTTSLDKSAANVFIQKFDVNTLESQPQFYLTSYNGKTGDAKGFVGARNPKVLKVNDDCILIPYMLNNSYLETKQIRMILTNSNGDVVWDKEVEYNSDNPPIPKFGQVHYDSATESVVWFSIVNKKLIANSISVDVPDSETTTGDQPTVPSIPDSGETTTQPATAPTTPSVPDSGETTTSQSPIAPTSPSVPETSAPDETTTQPEPPQNEPSFWDRVVAFFVGIYNWFVSLFS